MIKKPWFNALAAEAYIGLVALTIFNVPKQFEHEGGIFAPIAMLSLFVFSAAVMGYFFVLQPLQLYLDGQKKEAVNFFLQTLGYFALIALVLVLGSTLLF